MPNRIDQCFATLAAQSFIYYVSREGVTGAQDGVASSLAERVGEIRRHTKLPIAVGFGISSAEQTREVAQVADAVVIGSAIVQKIAENATRPGMPGRIGEFVRLLVAAVKGP
jgi:tryptophan synthase alpha chain